MFADTVLGNKGIKIDPPKSSPKSPPPPSLLGQTNSDSVIPRSEMHLISHNKNTFSTPTTTGLILKAVDDIEKEFWNYPLIEREDSVVIMSLYYLQKLFRF